MTMGRGPLGVSSNDEYHIGCPPSDGKEAFACWDCIEEGHLGGTTVSPSSPESAASWPGEAQESLAFGTWNLTTKQPDPALEVHHPEPGLELDKAPHNRWTQPGLEVASGPTFISNTEKQRALKAGTVYKHGRVIPDEKEVVTEPRNRKTVWGVQRRVCLLFLVVVILIIAAAVTLGVVLGLKEKRGPVDSSESASTNTGDNNNSTVSLATSLIQPQQSTIMETGSSSSTTSPRSSTTTQAQSSTTETLPSFSTPEAKASPPPPPPSSSLSTTTKEVISSTKKQPLSSITTEPKSEPEPATTEQPQQSTVIRTQPTTVVQAEPTTIIQQQPTTVIQQQPTTVIQQPTTTAEAPPAATTTTAAAKPTVVPTCPEADGTTYTDPKTGTKFKRTCSVQHPGYDIENKEKNSMVECMAWCATVAECKGAQWYNAGPQGTDLNYCWLKYDMTGGTRETEDAQSAVIID